MGGECRRPDKRAKFQACCEGERVEDFLINISNLGGAFPIPPRTRPANFSRLSRPTELAISEFSWGEHELTDTTLLRQLLRLLDLRKLERLADACLRTPTICSTLNRLFFISKILRPLQARFSQKTSIQFGTAADSQTLKLSRDMWICVLASGDVSSAEVQTCELNQGEMLL